MDEKIKRIFSQAGIVVMALIALAALILAVFAPGLSFDEAEWQEIAGALLDRFLGVAVAFWGLYLLLKNKWSEDAAETRIRESEIQLERFKVEAQMRMSMEPYEGPLPPPEERI